MIGALVLVVLVATVGTAVFGLVSTALNRPPDRAHRLVVATCEVLLVGQAVLAAVRVFGGVSLPEQTTFLIYLVVSVCVMPIALQFATAEPTRWGGAVIAIGALGTAVAVLRLQGLWAAGAGGA